MGRGARGGFETRPHGWGGSARRGCGPASETCWLILWNFVVDHFEVHALGAADYAGDDVDEEG